MEFISLLGCQQVQYSPKCFSLRPHPLLFPVPRKMSMLHRSPVVIKTTATTKTTAVMSNSSSSSSSSSSSQIISGDMASSVARRSADYKPNIWDYSFLQLLKSEFTGEAYEKQSKKLQEAVRHNYFNDEEMKTSTVLARLELIDNVERLGIGYLFKNEIKRALDNIVLLTTTINQLNQGEHDLHAISLYFRLLRQHGYEVSQDVFAHFMKDIEEMGRKPNTIDEDDIKGILSLYEASYLAYEGETILDEAKLFTTRYLNEIIIKEKNKYCLSPEMVKQVKHSLELPLHWKMLRLESRWYIENMSVAENDEVSSYLLELAKLDYNMVQAIHQDDLKDMSRWWRDLGLSGSDHPFSFARDRLLECFIWSLAGFYEPQFRYCRKALTKCNCLLTTIDDVYDLYGTLDELELFTDAVIRWDIDDEAMEQLPCYMKICFQVLYNTVKEIVNDTLKETSLDIENYLKKGWRDLCKAYLVEAKWYHNKYTPTLEEYLNNAWITVGGPIELIHSYLLGKQEITKEVLESLETYTDLIRWSSMIVRLCNDSVTSKAELERGDVAKSIQCYMKESGVSEDAACEHIRHLISKAWKKLNKNHRVLADAAADNSDPLITQSFKENALNLARMAQCIYMFGDGHGVQDRYNKERVLLLLVKPIS